MDQPNGNTPSRVKKQEDLPDPSSDKRDLKPVVKTLNRVPRMLSSYPLLSLAHPLSFSRRLRKHIPSLSPSIRSFRSKNACRKQKMRCEGADNPPCRRCRHAGLDCLFEKPSREATLTGEAGLEQVFSFPVLLVLIHSTLDAFEAS